MVNYRLNKHIFINGYYKMDNRVAKFGVTGWFNLSDWKIGNESGFKGWGVYKEIDSHLNDPNRFTVSTITVPREDEILLYKKYMEYV